MVSRWWRTCCGDCSVVGVVAWLVVVVWGAKLVAIMVVEIWSVQNNDSNRKTYLKGSQPGEHEEFPLNKGGEIYSEHKLSGITDLRTFMMFCKFPQP